jgi:hypothetical protein
VAEARTEKLSALSDWSHDVLDDSEYLPGVLHAQYLPYSSHSTHKHTHTPTLTCRMTFYECLVLVC